MILHLIVYIAVHAGAFAAFLWIFRKSLTTPGERFNAFSFGFATLCLTTVGCLLHFGLHALL